MVFYNSKLPHCYKRWPLKCTLAFWARTGIWVNTLLKHYPKQSIYFLPRPYNLLYLHVETVLLRIPSFFLFCLMQGEKIMKKNRECSILPFRRANSHFFWMLFWFWLWWHGSLILMCYCRRDLERWSNKTLAWWIYIDSLTMYQQWELF